MYTFASLNGPDEGSTDAKHINKIKLKKKNYNKNI